MWTINIILEGSVQIPQTLATTMLAAISTAKLSQIQGLREIYDKEILKWLVRTSSEAWIVKNKYITPGNKLKERSQGKAK